jgi:hypothetical protein
MLNWFANVVIQEQKNLVNYSNDRFKNEFTYLSRNQLHQTSKTEERILNKSSINAIAHFFLMVRDECKVVLQIQDDLLPISRDDQDLS